jgi:hypothetical protein
MRSIDGYKYIIQINMLDATDFIFRQDSPTLVPSFDAAVVHIVPIL